MTQKKRALLSVSDKTGLLELATSLRILGFEILATGGTANYLLNQGIEIISVEEVTHFPEMMDGRVKTLHPAIHGGLLAQLPKHQGDLDATEIEIIDLLCVNLYPFKETVANSATLFTDAIEQIDIGGPAMIRSGAKNHERVTVVVDPDDYGLVIQELSQYKAITDKTRRALAGKAYRHTASYDAAIAQYFLHQTAEELPETLTVSYSRHDALRYGENSHQKAVVYQDETSQTPSIIDAEIHHGKALSYNNYRDADSALRLLSEFTHPTAVAIKHMNPCGVGSGETLAAAFERCFESDPVSIFGGILAVNREVDLTLAKRLYPIFLEVIIAPKFTEEALDYLKKKKNIRLLSLAESDTTQEKKYEMITITGGLLVQEADNIKERVEDWRVVTKRKPTNEEIEALKFAWACVKHVKSNAIVITNANQTLGIGAGQMNRIGSVELALQQAHGRLEEAVLASDAFFPMPDSLEKIATTGIKAIIQPGGSIRDQESIDLANAADICMIFTDVRHFKH